MKKLVGWLLAALIPFAGVLVAVSATPSVVSATTTATSWPALEETALQVTSAYRGDGPLTTVGSPSSVSDSTVTTASGVITVAQQTVVATNGSGTVVLNLSLLGGRQLVVNEMSPAADYEGDALVLESGSSTIAGVYPLAGTNRSEATTAATHSHQDTTATDAVLHTSRGRGHQPTARLVTIGGCYADPQAPGVIGSTFGPLVQGEGIITCLSSESLAEIVSLYRGSTHVGTTGTGSGGGTVLGVNTYDGCTVISGTHSFHTAELWSVNGIVQGGATSTSANLHCT